MPRITKRKRNWCDIVRRIIPKQPSRKLIAAAAAALVCLVLLVVLIVNSLGGKPEAEPEPTPTPVPTPTAAPTEESGNIRANYRPAAEKGGFLPVFRRADTFEKIVCLTVTGCENGTNLAAILDAAKAANVPLTLFPTAKAAEEKGYIAECIRTAVTQGCEVENGTYAKAALYGIDAKAMADDIANGHAVLCRAAGKYIDMRFLYTDDGKDRYDLRTHLYLKKLGYEGIVYRTAVFSTESAETLSKGLAAGNIYELRCTNNDADRLSQFIAYAAGQGYRFVTLRDMFGYDPQEVRDLAGEGLTYPDPDPYEVTGVANYSLGWYSYDIYLIQQKLTSLGLLDHEPTGYFGNNTHEAVKKLQEANDLRVDGVADLRVQGILFGFATAETQQPASTSAPQGT